MAQSPRKNEWTEGVSDEDFEQELEDLAEVWPTLDGDEGPLGDAPDLPDTPGATLVTFIPKKPT